MDKDIRTLLIGSAVFLTLVLLYKWMTSEKEVGRPVQPARSPSPAGMTAPTSGECVQWQKKQGGGFECVRWA